MAREKERRTPLPQLVVTPTGFRVYDPVMVHEKKDLMEWRGKLERQENSTFGLAAILGMLLGGVSLAALLGASVLSSVLWFLAGAGGVFLVAAIASLWFDDPEETYRDTHRGAEPHREITDDPRLREVCSVAEEVAETRAWQDRVIDPDRQLAAVLWSSADGGASGEAAADIDQTLANLRELRRIAWELDHQREHGEPPADGRSATREPTVRARSLSDEMLEHGRTVRELS